MPEPSRPVPRASLLELRHPVPMASDPKAVATATFKRLSADDLVGYFSRYTEVPITMAGTKRERSVIPSSRCLPTIGAESRNS